MSMAGKKIVICGFYDHASLGDELFKLAFLRLLPDHELVFTDRIPPKDTADLLILGGGSFLDQPIASKHHSDGAKAPSFDEPIFGNGLGDPTCVPIAYVGVGCGNSQKVNIHPDHEILLRHAKLVILRSDSGLAEVSKLTAKPPIVISDLVYSLLPANYSKPAAPKGRVLLCPNFNCVPRYDDATWKHKSWEHFKFEFSQFLDYLIEEEGCSIDYLPMSTHPQQLDEYAMIEIRNLMHKGHLLTLRSAPFPGYPMNETDIKPLIDVFASYEAIITQRFHGMVLAEMAGTPYLSIAHHDKLTSSGLSSGYVKGAFVSYFACNKTSLIADFARARSIVPTKPPITSHSFETLAAEVIKLME
jgi:hypothetical protein